MVLVSTYHKTGEDNIKKAKEKLSNLGIPTDKLYFLPKDPPVEYVPQVYPNERL